MGSEKYRVNELLYDKNYITKTKIDSKFKEEYPMLSGVPLKEIQRIFDKCDYEVCRVGNSKAFYQQKHVKFVNKEELAYRVFRDYFRFPRKK